MLGIATEYKSQQIHLQFASFWVNCDNSRERHPPFETCGLVVAKNREIHQEQVDLLSSMTRESLR